MSSWQPQEAALSQIVDTILQSTNERNSQQVQHGITEVRSSDFCIQYLYADCDLIVFFAMFCLTET